MIMVVNMEDVIKKIYDYYFESEEKFTSDKIMNTLATSHGMDLVCNKDLIVETT